MGSIGSRFLAIIQRMVKTPGRGSGRRRAVGLPAAGAAASGDLRTTAKLEMGGVEGGGGSSFPPAGMGPLDEFLGQLGGWNPDAGSQPGILLGALGPQPCLSYCT